MPPTPDPTVADLDASIAELGRTWHEIACGRVAFGSGTATEQSVRFQMERLLPMSARRCRLMLDASIPQPTDALISLVGMSPQTTIMMAEALRPRQLLLVTSANAGSSVEAIHAWFARPEREWTSPTMDVRFIPPTDSEATAQVVRAWVADRRRAVTRGNVAFDATGGKKSMSVVAGMLAVQLELDVVYLDTTFDPSLRMPRPGSEVVVRIPIPR